MNEFKKKFTSSNPILHVEIDSLFSSCISEEENGELLRIPFEEEIKDGFWSLHPLKAPGPDGFFDVFYCSYWNIVKAQMV